MDFLKKKGGDVAEAFDCITSDCAYQPKRGMGEAIDEIEKCAGTQFDSEVVSIFLENRENAFQGNGPNLPASPSQSSRTLPRWKGIPST